MSFCSLCANIVLVIKVILFLEILIRLAHDIA
jgi:hypothetical protein